MNVLEAIDKYCLSIRKIPESVTSMWTHYEKSVLKESCELIHRTADELGIPEESRRIFDRNFPNGRMFQKEVTIPKNAGMYMCKSVNDTGSMVRWNSKTDNLANTLEESVNLFLKGVK